MNNQPSVVRHTPCMKEIMNCKLCIILLRICKLNFHSLKSLIWNVSPDGALNTAVYMLVSKGANSFCLGKKFSGKAGFDFCWRERYLLRICHLLGARHGWCAEMCVCCIISQGQCSCLNGMW